ncbi:phage shock protein E [Pseudoalteromonas citrea]|uniref:Phage shock protein E n=2 Tax=Pseudoalteromonas citrea TaxID=43655 RepID=A0AAD4FQB6_9GAMM|nr:rhodanese-like domain-containing protein [Pseudoalteromonas citrea]KAF7764970.1 phage shock protein E [Pseudoalteromonas citrea]
MKLVTTKNWMLVLFGMLLFSLMVSTLVQANITQVSQQTLLRQQMSSTPFTVIDVRTAQEYNAGHIKGAINIPFDQIAQHQAQLNAKKGSTLLVYCRSGRRAAIFEKQLQKRGFDVKHLTGDMNGWLASELPIIKNAIP